MLIDVQSLKPEIEIPIDMVGITDVKVPCILKFAEPSTSVATVSALVSLSENYKGTHMSRISEEILSSPLEISISSFLEKAKHLKDKLASDLAMIKAICEVFVRKSSPATKRNGFYPVNYELGVLIDENLRKIWQTVTMEIMTLCPCSKEISKYNAHNQRARVIVRVYSDMDLFHSIVKIVDEAASSPLFPILKRPDEKVVTESSYEKPNFVEDIARLIASKLENLNVKFTVEVKSFESIHPYNAFCKIIRDCKNTNGLSSST